jgi:two-component system phosphate regulon sensor histidine kinase PhoR
VTRAAARRLGLAARLALLLGGAAALASLATGLYVSRALEAQAMARLESSLVEQARRLREPFAALLGAAPGVPAVQERARWAAAGLGGRVTVIRADGTVLADSDPETGPEGENPAERPELRAALDGAVGSAVRRSARAGRDLLFVAVPLAGADGARGVLRLAVPTPDGDPARAVVRRSVAGGVLLGCTVALAVGLFVGRRVARPLRQMQAAARRLAGGDFERPVPVVGTDEVAALGEALNRMAVALREKIEGLDREQAKVRTILDAMAEGLVALNGRARILLLNPAARAMFEVGAGPADGRPLLEVIRQKPLLDVFAEVRATGASAARELELGPPVSRVIAARGAPLGLGPGGPGVLLVLQDVTELRRLERVRREFVTNVSHELRTPLTCIRGYLETLRDGALADPTEARRFLEVAATHAERLGRLVDDLLQLADIEGGRLRLVPIAVALTDAVAAVAAIFEGPAAEKRQTIEQAVPPGTIVRADRDRLIQILVNLVDNAVKFTPEGGRIRLAAHPAPGGRVEVEVADTGGGIPSADLPRITERFYRVDRTRSRELGGTGLGLAIVKHLVQAHGSELRIRSVLGRGTTVSFTLPAAGADAFAVGAQPGGRPGESGRGGEGRPS